MAQKAIQVASGPRKEQLIFPEAMRPLTEPPKEAITPVIEPELETAVKKQLGEMAVFTFPSSVQAKLDKLMDKNNEGKLTPEEREEYSALVKLNELVAILKGQAQLLLRSIPATR